MADPAESRLAALRKRWEEDRSSAAFVPLAEEYRRLGRLSEAITVLEQGMKAAPNYLSARIALGRCRLDLGDAPGACTILEQVVHQDPTQLVASKLLVEAYLRSHRPEQARERLNLYAVLNDRDPELDEFRRRVQQGLRAAEQSASERLDAAPVDEAPEPVVAALAQAAPEIESAPAPEPSVARSEVPRIEPPRVEAPTAAPSRPTGDLFQLAPVRAPAPDLGAMGALPRSAPAAGGILFGGLGTPEDRRRYVSALLRGSVFGSSAAAHELDEAESSGSAMPVPEPRAATAEPASVALSEGFTWSSVSIEPEPSAETEGPAGWAPVVGTETAEAPLAEADEAESFASGVEASSPSPADAIQPTATLGELYLSQGHRLEAQNIFERVLENQPDNPAAREGLESARRLGGTDGRQGVTARKVALLRDFLKRVRGGSEQHVS